MSLDLIKQYLVGIGFDVDNNSFENVEKSISNVDNTINKFSKNSNEGFSEVGSSFKDLFKLFGDTNKSIEKIFPNSKGPLKNMIKDISTIKNLYTDLTKINIKKEDTNSNNKLLQKETQIQERSYKPVNNNLIKSKKESISKNTISDFKDVELASKNLLNNGGKFISQFASNAIISFALITTSVATVIASMVKLYSYLDNLAKKEIEYEKLSRQLWTTKENAKEIDTSLKALGATMQDLWFSPTLLKQFNQLRQDSKDLKLPPEFNENLKTVQGISLEFKRFKQLLSLFFQWVGNYILKYCAGPLNDIKNSAKGFNNWLKNSIPEIAKVLGTLIGILARILLFLGKIFAFVINVIAIPIKLFLKLIEIIKNGFDKLPDPIKKVIKAIMLITNPILFIIGLIDDLLTYFRGGKSVIGSFIDNIKDKAKNAGEVIKGIITTIKAILTGGLSLVPWDKYWEKARETFEKIKEKAKETWDKVKEWASSKTEKAKESILGIRDKVKKFVSGEDKSSVSQSYVTSNNSNVSNNSTETKNSNNTVTNSNVFNVYGGNDAKSTANTVNKNITGITIRSLQGRY